MIIKSAEFIKSVSNFNDIYKSNYKEIAFVGRSNVGKSSLINFMTNNSKLAKTSSLPGRTRLINYFLINKEFLLVDLPGYGYAKASKEAQASWGTLLENYLKKSENLKAVYMLLDIRHLPNDNDKQMIKFLYYYNIPTVFVLTKADKLSKSAIGRQVQMIANDLGLTKDSFVVTSSDKKTGKDKLLDSLEARLTFENNPEKEEDSE